MTVVSLSSVWEECVAFVNSRASWLSAAGDHGNAYQLWGNAQGKLKTSATPVPGSVVVYGRGHGYDPAFGHVAIVEAVLPNGTFTVSESNFPYGGTPSSGRVSTMNDVLGFILPPPGATTKTQVPAAPTTYVSGGSNCQSLGYLLSPGAGGSGVAGVVSGFAAWIGQSCVHYRFAIGGIALFLIYFGLKQLGTPLPNLKL